MQHSSWQRRIAAAIALASLAANALADSAPVTSELTVEQVQVIDGRDVHRPASQGRPGDVLEYRATYTNHSASEIRGLTASLPIPRGTTLIDRSALPPDALASTDGEHFGALPLTRLLRGADGLEHRVEVPLSDYRVLRWSLGTLAPGKSEQVQARVRVDVAAAAATKPAA